MLHPQVSGCCGKCSSRTSSSRFPDLTGPGKLVVGIVATIVLCFAVSHWIGIRRILSNYQGKMQEVDGA
jgi:hypothetical protein